jgi:hypothetical protein
MMRKISSGASCLRGLPRLRAGVIAVGFSLRGLPRLSPDCVRASANDWSSCSGIYWGPSVRLVPDERYQTGMPTGATLSNHLIEQGEPAPPRNHMTSAAPMSTRARILIGLFVVVLVCVAYLWFFGFQTLIVEAYTRRRWPPDFSNSPTAFPKALPTPPEILLF